jgi:hypothetical protein
MAHFKNVESIPEVCVMIYQRRDTASWKCPILGRY